MELNFTADAPEKLVPVRVTIVPTPLIVGVKLDIVGARVKLVALVAVPPGVVTLILPVVAPAGTVTVMLVALITVKLVAAVALNFTADASVKLVPVRVTMVPMPPRAGVKLDMVGAGMTVKLVALVAVPPGVVTLILPVVAPIGTVTLILVVLTTVKLVAAGGINLDCQSTGEVSPGKGDDGTHATICRGKARYARSRDDSEVGRAGSGAVRDGNADFTCCGTSRDGDGYACSADHGKTGCCGGIKLDCRCAGEASPGKVDDSTSPAACRGEGSYGRRIHRHGDFTEKILRSAHFTRINAEKLRARNTGRIVTGLRCQIVTAGKAFPTGAIAAEELVFNRSTAAGGGGEFDGRSDSHRRRSSIQCYTIKSNTDSDNHFTRIIFCCTNFASINPE